MAKRKQTNDTGLIMNVGDLKRALASLDDSLPIGLPSGGGMFTQGIELRDYMLTTLGHRIKHRITVAVNDSFANKYKGFKSKPKKVIIIIK